MQTPANPPKIAAFKFSSIFLRRIVGAMFTRVNSKCAHQVRPPPSPISGNDAQLAIEAFDDGKPPRTPPREPSSNPGMVRDLFDDMRFGLRLIRKHPGLSAATVLTFTLGLGLDAGVFTVIDGLMFRPRVGYNPGSFVEITEDVADATGRIAAAPPSAFVTTRRSQEPRRCVTLQPGHRCTPQSVEHSLAPSRFRFSSRVTSSRPMDPNVRC